MESTESFQEKDKYFEKLYNLYKDNLDELYIGAENNVVRKEYGRGGEVIHRGFYCPSPVQDIIVGNCNRGKLVKNPRKQPDYEFGFDRDDRLILVKQFCVYNNNIPPTTELLFYDSDEVNSILYQKDDKYSFRISQLTRCVYENGSIKTYDSAGVFDPSADRTEMLNFFKKTCPKINEKFTKGLQKNEFLKPYVRAWEYDLNNNYEPKICTDITTENFEYKDKILVVSTLESYNFDVKIIQQSKYFYNYDDNRKIISYTTEEYDNGKRIPCIWDGHTFQR